MEGFRFVLAIVLSIAVVILVNLLFPPGTPPDRIVSPDTVVVDTLAVDTLPTDTAWAAPEQPIRPDTPAFGPVDPTADVTAADTVWVETDVARFGIATRGGAVVSALLTDFESFTRPGPVELVEEGTRLIGYQLRLGDRRIPFDGIQFTPSLPAGQVTAVSHVDTLRLVGALNGNPVELQYTFASGDYLVWVEGQIGGLGGADATLLVELGPRLAVNEADSAEDLRLLSYVTYSRRTGVESVRITNLGQDRIEEGPLAWAALRNKYFVVAALDPFQGQGAFGGVVASGGPQGAESIHATLPLDRAGTFDLRFYFGPQQHRRLAALGAQLEEVNPYGWRVFRPIIRPLAEIVTWLLVGGREVLGLGYGWVLILFGFAMRGLLWPLNAKAMRSQLKTMELQPRIKEMQTKYKEKPEQLQKEMMRLYKEEGFNPLGGCIPMLIPWPVLITLFFVFQNTIEFRGVEFLWLPDLSRPDPYYILPLLLGVSLWGLQYLNMRAAPQDNPQMKMMLWFLPILMVVIFLNFASGLNLYYAASNVASLPQQILIIRERKRVKARMEAKDAAKPDEPSEPAVPEGKGKKKGGGKSPPSSRRR
jgi:YidC/Oxa1 family membrane protein insertase